MIPWCYLGKLHWTYKLEDGVCLDSMAIHTAKQYQIHESILNRAEELSTNFDHLFRSNFSLSLSSSSSSPSSSSSSLSSWIMNRMDNGTSCHDMGDGNGRRSMVVDQCHYDLIDFQPLLVRWFDHYSSYFSNSIIIPGNATSPPSLEGRSCLYVLRITDSNQVGSFLLLMLTTFVVLFWLTFSFLAFMDCCVICRTNIESMSCMLGKQIQSLSDSSSIGNGIFFS